ncbi:MAG: ABC transporter permease subunit, partial [Hydrogenophaga sp.]|nr:ABC transporter permease subunit [Hydrogenophaga sp.]
MELAAKFFGGFAALRDPKEIGRAILMTVGVPLAAFAIFLALWSFAASRIETSLGAVPGPTQVASQAVNLVQEHLAERERRDAFYQRQEKRNAERLKEDPSYEARIFPWTGKATYIDQILTSLKTVFVGFLLATIVAVPVGILAGTSKVLQAAINPMVQLFRPVSPLAWLPIVTLIVSALYVTSDPMFQKSFLISAITVTLCSLWTTLINTAIGVSSVDKDLVNVGKVLQLPLATRIRKIILPSSLPFIFTGMRLSLGVGWMVLIA